MSCNKSRVGCTALSHDIRVRNVDVFYLQIRERLFIITCCFCCFIRVIFEGNLSHLCSLLDLCPLYLSEKLFQGVISRAHELNPANDLELIFHFLVSGVHEPVLAGNAAFAAEERKESLETMFYAAPKTHLDPLEIVLLLLFRICKCLRLVPLLLLIRQV